MQTKLSRCNLGNIFHNAFIHLYQNCLFLLHYARGSSNFFMMHHAFMHYLKGIITNDKWMNWACICEFLLIIYGSSKSREFCFRCITMYFECIAKDNNCCNQSEEGFPCLMPNKIYVRWHYTNKNPFFWK